LEQLLAAGIAVAGVDVGEAYGSPASREVFETFFQEVTQTRGLAARPALLGRSRGGLWCGNWAADHPERFTGLAGIYPVFDWRTYPGVAATARAYGVSEDELLARQAEWNPIARGDILAKAQLPVFIIHGDQDDVVPLAENSAALADCYRIRGAAESLVLEVVPGQGHNYWEGFFRSPTMVEFLIQHARRGADVSGR
jgi:pimeloyl-ACP methyl ester carboxylesterase